MSQSLLLRSAYTTRFISWCCQSLVQRSVSNVLNCSMSVFRHSLWGVGETSSPPPPSPVTSSATVARVLRRERDCTLTLFLAASVSTSSTSPCSSGGGRDLHLTPSSSHCRWGTSEEEGQVLLFTAPGMYFVSLAFDGELNLCGC